MFALETGPKILGNILSFRSEKGKLLDLSWNKKQEIISGAVNVRVYALDTQ